jgi:hypothetical protein
MAGLCRTAQGARALPLRAARSVRKIVLLDG